MNKVQAQIELEKIGERSDEETGALMATAYPELPVNSFVNLFLCAVDMDRFDSDTGHVDCPISCVVATLAYQEAGGKFL